MRDRPHVPDTKTICHCTEWTTRCDFPFPCLQLIYAKVELVKVTTPEDSRSEHEVLTQHAEAVLKVSSSQKYSLVSLVLGATSRLMCSGHLNYLQRALERLEWDPMCPKNLLLIDQSFSKLIVSNPTRPFLL